MLHDKRELRLQMKLKWLQRFRRLSWIIWVGSMYSQGPYSERGGRSISRPLVSQEVDCRATPYCCSCCTLHSSKGIVHIDNNMDMVLSSSCQGPSLPTDHDNLFRETREDSPLAQTTCPEPQPWVKSRIKKKKKGLRSKAQTQSDGRTRKGRGCQASRPGPRCQPPFLGRKTLPTPPDTPSLLAALWLECGL